jgi:hypothetical protein
VDGRAIRGRKGQERLATWDTTSSLAFLTYHIENGHGALVNISVGVDLLDHRNGDVDTALGDGLGEVQRSLQNSSCQGSLA